jgi:hypothetical protein
VRCAWVDNVRMTAPVEPSCKWTTPILPFHRATRMSSPRTVPGAATKGIDLILKAGTFLGRLWQTVRPQLERSVRGLIGVLSADGHDGP